MKINKTQWKHFAIAFALFALTEMFLPVENGLTDAGKNFLAIFIGLVYLWMTIDTFVSSMIALAAFGLIQVTKSSDLFAGAFGNGTVAIFIFACIMITAARECGVMKKIALWFISRKITAGHPYTFLLMVALSGFVLGALVTNTYSLLIICPILLSVCERLNYNRGDRFYLAVFLIALWSVLGGANALPFAKTIFLSMDAAATGYGISISYARIIAFGAPIGLIWCLLGIPVIKYVVRPDFSNFMSYDPEEIREEMKAEPLTKQGRIVTCGFFAMTLLWCLTIFSSLFPFAAYLNKIGFHIIGSAVIAVLCIIQVDGGPALNLREIMPKLSWPVAGFLAMIMFTSSGFSNADFGIKDCLISFLSPVFADVSPVVLVIVGVVGAGIMTNLMSNVVTCVVSLNVFLPLLMSVSDLGGISPAAFCLAVTSAAGMSCATPSAFAGSSLIFGEHLDMKDSIKPNLIMVFLGLTLCCIFALVF